MALIEFLASLLGAVLDRPILATTVAVLIGGGIYLRHLSDVLVVAARWTRFLTLAAVVVGALLVGGVWVDGIDLNASVIRQFLDALPIALEVSR